MNKQQFLEALNEKIRLLPPDDIKRSLDYYEEMIDDRIEDGVPEEQAVEDMGSPDEIMKQLVEYIPLQKLVKVKMNPPRSFRVWEIVLIILGSPLWVSLLLAVAALAFALVLTLIALYVTVWAVIATLYAGVLAVAVSGVAAIVCGFIPSLTGGFAHSVLMISAGLICLGLSVFLFLGVNLVTKLAVKLTRMLFTSIKLCLIRKGNQK